MAKEIKMPASGQTAAESKILRWNVKEGDEIKRGDVLFEIETDKATMGVESYAKGILLKIVHGEGEDVEAGGVVAYIGEAGEAVGEQAVAADDEEEYKPIVKERAQSVKAAEKLLQSEKSLQPAAGGVVMASPAARRLAKQRGIDIAALYRSLGRVVKSADVQGAGAQTAGESAYEIIAPSAMRRTIARRMLESASEAPQFTVTIKADMTDFIQVRRNMNKFLVGGGIKITVNDLLVKCVCAAATQVPYVVGQYVSDQEIRLYKHIHVGVAVALPDGLVVPVIRSADMLGLREIAQKNAALVETAREGRLTEAQMTGGSITISNLGMFGIDSFTALVNRPESTILAVGGIVETPVARNGEVKVRPIMDITASFDHRLVDGGTGALFMSALKRMIECPAAMLI